MAKTVDVSSKLSGKAKFDGAYLTSFPSSAPVRNAGNSVNLATKAKFDIRPSGKKAQSAKEIKGKIKPSMR